MATGPPASAAPSGWIFLAAWLAAFLLSLGLWWLIWKRPYFALAFGLAGFASVVVVTIKRAWRWRP